MKYLLNLRLVLLIVLALFSCNTDNDTITDNLINGRWKLFEAYVSSGGPQYLIKIENGEEFMFSDNGKFESNKFQDCTNGLYKIGSGNLILRYGCDGFETGVENSNGEITYKISFESGYLVMIPTSVICIEACSYRYKKI